jgi:parvulin-like peptidyl-prolyl isomerase
MTQQMDLIPAVPRNAQWKRQVVLAIGGIVAFAVCVVVRYQWGGNPVSAEPQETAAAPEPAAPAQKPRRENAKGPSDPTAGMKTVASVNGETISREELAQECLRHYGAEVLEALVNKYLIMTECQKRNITVTQEEVSTEITQMAKRFNLPVDQWLKMLKQERGIGPAQYGSDIIWPSLALRKLAGDRLNVTKDELVEEYEHQFGESVKARMIVCSTQQEAQKIRADAVANPAEFGNLAKELSKDASSASVRGMIPAIRRHSGNPEVEKALFSMKDGEISQVIKLGNQFLIVQRESLVPARDVSLDQAKPQLELVIRDRKQRTVANDVFQALQKNASVENVFNNPARSKESPGVAAVVNGNQVTVRELAERCIERYGDQVLEGAINRKLIEQACKKNNITITEGDLDAEINRTAGEMLPLKNGQPDVEKWLKLALNQQRVPLDVYRRDSIWPAVAIRKLLGNRVEVTEDDLKMGYEANYGPRVRCRAIILDSERRAHEVWRLARQHPTVDNFGDLAVKYSIEANTRTMRGEVPPIQRHGGQPTLEKEAFKLKAGELSGIVTVDSNKFVILFCEGHTVPGTVEFATVKELILADVREKKTRVAMGDIFRNLQDEATVDNFLAGTTHSPKRLPSAPSQTSPAAPNASNAPTAAQMAAPTRG